MHPKNDVTTRLEAFRAEMARQDETLREAEAQLSALGNVTLAVPRAALEAIHAACLIHLPPLGRDAIRA